MHREARECCGGRRLEGSAAQDCRRGASAAENQRDAYKAALKGGTFWTRTKKAAKFLAIGGAIGVGLVCASGHCK